jgi:molybdopterin-guanine dinucleotide biosynthesis protein MobB
MQADRSDRPPAVAVVGRSGAGKTTLLEELLPALEQRGLRVGAVKHASHGFLADRPGKDSHRLYEAGARAVALVSCEQVATFVRVEVPAPTHRDPRLGPVLAGLPAGLDLVLVEGFSWEPVPRVVVVPAGEAPLPEHLAGGPVLERVAAPPVQPGVRPAYSPQRVADLADRLARLARRATPPPGRPAAARAPLPLEV